MTALPLCVPRVGDLFSGIGGFALATEAVGWSTAWFCEIDPFCRATLAHHWPAVPIHGDITTLDFFEVEPVDILTAGFPCQPASHAGKRAGTADVRWLWPFIAGAVRALRPRWVVLENVPGLLSVNGGRAFAEVLRDLAGAGYDAEWNHLSAATLGAPHKRERLWIVAHAEGTDGRSEQPAGGARSGRAGPSGIGGELGNTEGNGYGVPRRLHANAPGRVERGNEAVGDCASGGRGAGEGLDVRRTERGCAGLRLPDWSDAVPHRGADGTVRLIPRGAVADPDRHFSVANVRTSDAGTNGRDDAQGCGGHIHQEAGPRPESSLWPVADGVPGRVARLRAIGNSVVPAWVVEGPFRMILAQCYLPSPLNAGEHPFPATSRLL